MSIDPKGGILLDHEDERRIRELTAVVQQNEQSLAGFAAAFLSRLGGGAVQDVEDVLTDAYLAAAVRLRNDSSLVVKDLLSWFRRVLFLTCLDYSRRRARHRSHFVTQLREEDELLESLAADPTVERDVAVREALGRLTAQERRIIELSAEGYTSEEIAGFPEIALDNAASVRQSKARAFEKLRPYLRSSP